MDYYTRNKSYYDRNAHQYEAASWYYFNKYKNDSVVAELKKCASLLRDRPAIKILEVGPGTGYLLGRLLALSKAEIHFTGIDHSSEMASVITERYRESCRSFKIIVDTVTADQLKRTFRDEKYDLVMGSSILCHFQDYADVVTTLAQLLNGGGVMYFVREPIHEDDCKPGNVATNALEKLFNAANEFLMAQPVRRRLWPGKVKAGDATGICPANFDEGISVKPFEALQARGFRLVFLRRYNRRVSWILSYLENKWLAGLRKDILGNTLFSIGLQSPEDPD